MEMLRDTWELLILPGLCWSGCGVYVWGEAGLGAFRGAYQS